ncbi:MAG: prepilin-type N-terminal cleavage/methylation domain-containing protein [Candidatus Omnitrophica bacterium]|nr:prepilin-type N-terminal cleavage/methylation domain-containing protein [Candidatus Omnitrophota bacterium]
MRNYPKQIGNRKGFSLLELIIAIGVLAIGLVGVLQIFPVGLRASQRAGTLTKAAFLAQNKMEEVKMAGFDAIAELPPKIPLSGSDPDFEWEIFIDDVALDGIESDDNMRKVKVKVTWTERNNKKTKDFITYVTR